MPRADKFKSEQLDYMYQRTLFMRAMAVELGDEFLQYMYEMVLCDLEEKASGRHGGRRRGKPCPVDPQIAKLAAKLCESAPANGD